MCLQANMWSLYCARFAEGMLGHKCFLSLYMVSGLSGSLFSFLLSKHPSVGASGAIMGVFGGLFVSLGDNYQYFGGAAKEMRKSLLWSVALTLGLGFALPLLDQWYGPCL
jgi:rhomboid protease GluP